MTSMFHFQHNEHLCIGSVTGTASDTRLINLINSQSVPSVYWNGPTVVSVC